MKGLKEYCRHEIFKKTPVLVSFLCLRPTQLYSKETPTATQLLSQERCEIFENTCFKEYLETAFVCTYLLNSQTYISM